MAVALLNKIVYLKKRLGQDVKFRIDYLEKVLGAGLISTGQKNEVVY